MHEQIWHKIILISFFYSLSLRFSPFFFPGAAFGRGARGREENHFLLLGLLKLFFPTG